MSLLRKPWAAAACLVAWISAGTLPAADYWMYIGTYTSAGSKGVAGKEIVSKGIYVSRFQPDKTKATTPVLAADTANPSFFAVHPNHRWLYAVNENGSQTVMGSVSAYAIDARSGKLSPLNWVSSKGGGPCHLALDRSAKWLAVANYASGSVTVLPVEPDGKLGEASAFVQQQGSSVNPQRQSGPHAHEVVFSPDNQFLLVPDLGADKIFVYRFDADHGTLAPNDPPSAAARPGSGPRHLVFHPNGKMVYVINELASTVTAYNYDAARGTLEELQSVSTLSEGFGGTNTAAELAINSDGTRIYASNRGSDTVALLAVDPVTFAVSGMEFPPAMVQKPRFFALDPAGDVLVVAGQDSGRLQLFAVHPHTGQIQPRGRPIRVPNPVCVAFVPID